VFDIRVMILTRWHIFGRHFKIW